MENTTLVQYIKQRILSGVSRSVIEEELRTVGWSEEDIVSSYREALIASGLPIPDEQKHFSSLRKSSTVDIVINFFSFILLGIIVSALGVLLFSVVDATFPDALYRSMYAEAFSASAIHYAVSALIIGFPLYYFSLRLWFRTFREDEGRVESKLSQWLTYLVLLITAVTIVGDFITIIFTFLQGEITVRFFLKALIILVIAGIVFGFYYLERRKIQYHIDIPQNIFFLFGRVVTGLLLFSIILGFFITGSPLTERKRALDRTRVEHLDRLSGCIEEFAQTFGRLPESMDDLKQTNQFAYCSSDMFDPETAMMYPYRIVIPSRVDGQVKVGEFELCAIFAFDTEVSTVNAWEKHSAGKSCHTMRTQLLVPLGSDGQKFLDSTPINSLQ